MPQKGKKSKNGGMTGGTPTHGGVNYDNVMRVDTDFRFPEYNAAASYFDRL